MVSRRSQNYLRSRNTLIMFAILFLIVIVVFKFVIGFMADNIIIYTGTIVESGNIDPSIFKIDWDGLDFSKLNPLLWQIGDVKESINNSLHELVDLIAPAVVNLMSMVIAQGALIRRSVESTPMLLCDKSNSSLTN